MSLNDYSATITITIKRPHDAHVNAYFMNFHWLMMAEAAKTQEGIFMDAIRESMQPILSRLTDENTWFIKTPAHHGIQ